MDSYFTQVQVRWSDLDPNFHLRHSVYYDWGALCRIEFFYKYGLTSNLMQQLNFGPILFREECLFKKEISLGDQVTINLKLLKAKKNYSRWSIQHEIFKDDDNIAAILTVDGSWLNMVKRKLAIPHEKVTEVFAQMPVAHDFHWLD